MSVVAGIAFVKRKRSSTRGSAGGLTCEAACAAVSCWFAASMSAVSFAACDFCGEIARR